MKAGAAAFPLMQPRILEVRRNILHKNDELARDLRQRYAQAGLYAVNMVSSPGSGKTELLARTLAALQPNYRPAALTGDLATENDARRLASTGAPARQILTGTLCHLEAAMVAAALDGWLPDELDFLFIENVGNLVCPSAWDLGEDLRVLLISVTEGEDKPLKYPTIVNSADLVLISKIDLASAVGFDLELAERNIAQARPGVPILRISARTGEGMDGWLDLLRTNLFRKRRGAKQVNTSP